MLIIGLTGGIGAGKSIVEQMFRTLGILCIDADRVAREVVTPGSEALGQIVARYGEEILKKGALNRQALREHIFAHPEERQWLEGLLHLKILKRMQAQTLLASSVYVIWSVPLLFEQDWQQHVDRSLVVDCSEKTQLLRAMQRDGATAEQVRAILHSQHSRQQRLMLADDRIDNEGQTLAQLGVQIQAWDHRYRELAHIAQEKE